MTMLFPFMQTGFQVYEILKDRYWSKTAFGKPMILLIIHEGYGLLQNSIDFSLQDIVFNYADSDRIEPRPFMSL